MKNKKVSFIPLLLQCEIKLERGFNGSPEVENLVYFATYYNQDNRTPIRDQTYCH